MKIKELKLFNFGIYAGKQDIDFSVCTNKRPIILLGGYNGRGKTTILEAILLCLYGRRSYALIESKISYNSYLSKYINRADKSSMASIELTLTAIIDSNEVELKILRKWAETGKTIKEDLVITRNGIADDVLTDNWDNQMDHLMPVGISRFFLFDGEKLAELLDDYSQEKLKHAIKTLFGIDVIEQLQEDLKGLVNKNKIVQKIELQNADAASLREKRDALVKGISLANTSMVNIRQLLEKDTNALAFCESQFSEKGGMLFSNQESTLLKKTLLEKKIRDIQTQIYEKLAGVCPLLLVKPLINAAEKNSSLEQSGKIIDYEIKGIERIFTGISLPQKALDEIEKLRIAREHQLKIASTQSLGISTIGAEQLLRIKNIDVDMEVKELENLIRQKNEIQLQLDKHIEYLSIEINRKSLAKLVEEMKVLNRNITKNQVQLDSLNAEIHSKENELNNVNSALDKITEKLLEQFEAKDNSVRLVKYATMSRRVLLSYTERLQKIKVKTLSQKATEKFLEIIGKKTLISKIVFDEQNLELSLFDDKGKPFNRRQLSAGEQQLLSIAIMWGIIECTGQEFPIIIDTPLARLDSVHRELFIDNFVPKVGKQIIILSTDAEIVNGIEKRIDNNVAKKYLLQYNENTKSTNVVEGYFEGVKL